MTAIFWRCVLLAEVKIVLLILTCVAHLGEEQRVPE
jgi:hypothetical protein